MLSRLHVRNYVLIDSLEIDFPEGLIIITGQTGAGKSILLGALSLIMGAKADASMLSEGAENCIVEAEFDVDDPELSSLLEENDIDQEDSHIIIRRLVGRTGRSRSFVNDCPVSVQLLQDISSKLIDIHSQHQTLLLSDRNFQMDLLDHFAGSSSLREECRELWKELSLLKSELSELDEKIRKTERDKDYNEAQFRQLEAASLRIGELEELELEQKKLANAEEIRNGLSTVEALFCASHSDEALSLDAILKESSKQLSKLGRYIPSASELSERLDSCRHELDDVLSEVSYLNSRTDVSEERLAEIESRMSLLYGLFQKYSCRDESELIALRDRLSDELFDSTQLLERRDDICAGIERLSSDLDRAASALHDARAKAAPDFAVKIQDSVRFQELPFAVFDVELSEVATGPAGKDKVTFRFSASGRNPVDLARCASGGEMSRIMLALKSMAAKYANMPTMIFDEIDTGVSGSVADKMGSMICDMGADMQVFAITHLPQVAAKGSAHYLVSKEIDPSSGTAISKIERLSDEGRVLELARMLSGSTLTEAAVANAKSLLSI